MGGLGGALRALRQRRGETVSGLARRLGVARNTVQRWELGERSPSIADLTRLLEELGATDDDVVEVMRAAGHGAHPDSDPNPPEVCS